MVLNKPSAHEIHASDTGAYLTGATNPSNYLTIDVEDYFQVHALSKVIKPEEWNSYECRVEKNTYYILDLLDSYRSIQNSTLNILLVPLFLSWVG